MPPGSSGGLGGWLPEAPIRSPLNPTQGPFRAERPDWNCQLKYAVAVNDQAKVPALPTQATVRAGVVEGKIPEHDLPENYSGAPTYCFAALLPEGKHLDAFCS